MIFRADLLHFDGKLYVGVRGRAAQLNQSHRHQTLCEAAVQACQNGILRGISDKAQLVGFVDASAGEVRLAPGAASLVQSAWGAIMDRRQLASVGDEKAASERNQFRNAVIRGDQATIHRLGPRRGYRW